MRDNANTASDGPAIEPDLATIIERWPDLPVAIKSGIVAMAKAKAADDNFICRVSSGHQNNAMD